MGLTSGQVVDGRFPCRRVGTGRVLLASLGRALGLLKARHSQQTLSSGEEDDRLSLRRLDERLSCPHLLLLLLDAVEPAGLDLVPAGLDLVPTAGAGLEERSRTAWGYDHSQRRTGTALLGSEAQAWSRSYWELLCCCLRVFCGLHTLLVIVFVKQSLDDLLQTRRSENTDVC